MQTPYQRAFYELKEPFGISHSITHLWVNNKSFSDNKPKTPIFVSCSSSSYLQWIGFAPFIIAGTICSMLAHPLKCSSCTYPSWLTISHDRLSIRSAEEKTSLSFRVKEGINRHLGGFLKLLRISRLSSAMSWGYNLWIFCISALLYPCVMDCPTIARQASRDLSSRRESKSRRWGTNWSGDHFAVRA